MFGLSDSHIWDISDVFAGRCGLEDALVKTDDNRSLYVLPAPLRTPEDPHALTEFILKTVKEILCSGQYDHVILDCPSGAGRGIEDYFFKNANVIVVATPDVTSIHDAQAIAAAAYAKGASVSLVVNRINAKAVEEKKAPDIDEMIDTVGIRLFGLIPEDKKTSEALNSGVLTVDTKRARSKKAYENIAARTDGVFTELYKFW